MKQNLTNSIKYLPIDSLHPYTRNARTHSGEQIDRIAASIQEFGFLNPILIDSASKTIIAGHGRLLAAQRLGLDKVPTVAFAHLTDTQRRAYTLADNKLALEAGWDDELLKIELDELRLEEQLQQLERLQPKLTITAVDYRDVKIEPNAVVYCDIPYKNTVGYLKEFKHDDFYQWAATRSFPVFISEYQIDDKRFKCVYEIDKRSNLSPKKELNAPDKVEKLYWNQVKLT